MYSQGVLLPLFKGWRAYPFAGVKKGVRDVLAKS